MLIGMKLSIYHYDPHSYNGQGEAFFYGKPENALSIFRFPNSNNLRGISLHIHPECDDIDILIKGELLFSNDGKMFRKVCAPAIVAN